MDAITVFAAESEEKVPIIEVAFQHGMWWALPQDVSRALYDKHRAGEDNIVYTYDWGTQRSGSRKLDDAETSINRYLLDFEAGVQRNIDYNRHRTMRIVWVDPSTTTPRWTGQIPNKRTHTDH